MKACGTCLNYRYDEDGNTYRDWCSLDPSRLCGYHCVGCEAYDPDVEYIKFMGMDKEDSDDRV